jgi:hypothetical protein
LKLEGGLHPAFQTLLFEAYPDSYNPACPGFPQTQRDTQRFYPHCIISKLISMADASVRKPTVLIAPLDERCYFCCQPRETTKFATDFNLE